MKAEIEYKFKSGEYRPCIVKATDKKALFHRWTENPTYPGMTFALIELENGNVRIVNPDKIRFLDSYGMFSEICWNMGDKEHENL